MNCERPAKRSNRCHSVCWSCENQTRSADIAMSLHILYSLFLIVYSSPLITAGCADQYLAVRESPNGPALCGTSTPETTHEVRLVSVCSAKCSLDDSCLYFNYITSDNQQPVCQLYNSQPQSTIADSQCILIAVSLTAPLLSFSLKYIACFVCF